MQKIDLEAVDAIIKEVAVTEIMPRFRQLAEGDIEMKGVNDPVTVADKAAEAALIARLTAYLPGSVVVGEESFAADPHIAERFNGDDYVWVIDPIDGTRNFIRGNEEFGVMIALMRRGQTEAAWIHHPASGDTLVTERGGGVWLRGGKMLLAGVSEQAVGLIGTRLRAALKEQQVEGRVGGLPKMGASSCSAIDYARLFTGAALFGNSVAERTRFAIYFMAKPWDHLAGLLMLHEAGGYSADWYGQSYRPTVTDKGLIVAADRAEWNAVHTTFTPIFEHLHLGENRSVIRLESPFGEGESGCLG